MKIIIFIILFTSFCYPHTASEYSLGLSDKLGLYGLLTKTWIYENNKSDYYLFAGTSMIIIGGAGAGYKYYLYKGDFSPYINISGFSFYVLSMSENGEVGGSNFNISASIGTDITAIDWKDNAIKLHFGIITMYNIENKESLVLSASNGPQHIMPTFNIKVYFGGK